MSRHDKQSLRELIEEFNKRVSPFNHFVERGILGSAFLMAMEMETLCRKIQARLNEIEYR